MSSFSPVYFVVIIVVSKNTAKMKTVKFDFLKDLVGR